MTTIGTCLLDGRSTSFNSLSLDSFCQRRDTTFRVAAKRGSLAPVNDQEGAGREKKLIEGIYGSLRENLNPVQ